MASKRASGSAAGFVALVGGGLLLASSFACGTEPVGVEACRKIERVRCESAQACGIDLGHPVHEGFAPERNVAACIRYYDDQCLHGLSAPKEPRAQDVDACVNAIIVGDCNVVAEPQDHPSCAFLIPPKAAPPAADAAPADAGPSTDATTD